ncbi:MAG: hypothetical protein AAGG38_11460 [Planctomycetota bacterium]
MSHRTRLRDLRPLVRYVDQEQAVVEVHFTALPAVSVPGRHGPSQSPRRAVNVALQLDGNDGFRDEGRTRVSLEHHRGRVRFEVVRPERWWPAGMGAQPLYTLTLTLTEPGYGTDTQAVTFGLASVRRDRVLGDAFQPSLLIHGQICDIDAVLPLDRAHQSALLPATGESLVLVRDHYGPDLLYDAADRAGILLIQCVPLHPQAEVEHIVAQHVARLAPHPSLAGYFVGHLGDLREPVTRALRQHDPTRPVFHRFPLYDAA